MGAAIRSAPTSRPRSYAGWPARRATAGWRAGCSPFAQSTGRDASHVARSSSVTSSRRSRTSVDVFPGETLLDNAAVPERMQVPAAETAGEPIAVQVVLLAPPEAT